MNIEIMNEQKQIISDISINLWKNDPVFEKLFKITSKSFIKDRDSCMQNKALLDIELNYIIKKIYEHGYYKGIRENKGDSYEDSTGYQPTAEQVYPTNGFTIAD